MRATRPRSFGLRAQILIGLALVTLVAVGSTGYLGLWVGGAALSDQRATMAVVLATAAAASASAVVEPQQPISNATSRTRLVAVARDLTEHTEARQVTFFQLDRTVVLAQPSRHPDDRDPPLLGAVLSGAPPVYQYRPRLDDGETEIIAYAPISLQSRVLGAVRVSLSVQAPPTMVLRRSGWLLVSLALADALLVLGLGYLVLTQVVVQPLQAVERATARVTAGDWDHAVKPSGPREVAALADSFNTMMTSLASQREQLIRSEKLASVGHLAAGIAHEIGNPLAAILGFVDILRADAAGGAPAMAPSERRDLLDRVKAETQRIHRTISDLLEYSRPSREEAQAIDPMKILKASQGLLEPQKRFRSVRVVYDEQPDQAPQVLVSPGRLQQVFVNLLLNAADAMDGQGTVTVSCVRADRLVRVTFTDSGPGVGTDMRRRIFDPFFTTKPPGQGTGLGLAISRSIVESYGGTLDIEAGGGSGATFVVTLPVAVG